MLKARKYFPLGKAGSEAFCNRKLEQEWLLKNIEAGKHSLIIAPRRYGKSSLAEIVIQKSKLPSQSMSFNSCSDEQEIVDLFSQRISRLIGLAIGPVEKWIDNIRKYLTHLTPQLIFGSEMVKLELKADPKKISLAMQLEETLNLLEQLLAEKKQNAVLLLDEFQAIGLIAKGTGVEAAIRNAAQGMQYLSLVFSGSNRSLLLSMFEDDKRPLYKLCRKLKLERIEASEYQKHINKAAKLAWGEVLPAAVFTQVMDYSERHPYYVNYLCDVIFTECDALPTIKDVQQAWNIVLSEEESAACAEIANLSPVQKKVLKMIAGQSVEEIFSAKTIQELGIASSSLASGLGSLLEKDIVDREGESRYRVINPIIKCWIEPRLL